MTDLMVFDSLFQGQAVQHLGQARAIGDNMFLFNSEGTLISVRKKTDLENFIFLTRELPRENLGNGAYAIVPKRPHYQAIRQIWSFDPSGNFLELRHE